jgi:hypothetical protein
VFRISWPSHEFLVARSGASGEAQDSEALDALAREATPEGTTEAATAPSILEHGHADNDTDTEKAELIAAYVVTCMRRGPASTFHAPIPSLLLLRNSRRPKE